MGLFGRIWVGFWTARVRGPRDDEYGIHAKKHRDEPGGMKAARLACAHSFSTYPKHERGITPIRRDFFPSLPIEILCIITVGGLVQK